MKTLVCSLSLLAAASAWAAEMVDAEVRKVDREASRITLKHGEIKALDMPPMTMVFHVKDKAVLDRFKAGDKVRFSAVKDAGQYTVIEIEPAR
jgi:Cu/Ag efflux protein CusF